MDSHEFPKSYFGAMADNVPLDTKDVLRTSPSYKRRYLLPFIQTLPKNARVLDAGCGKGKTIRLVNAFRPDITIVGSDITDLRQYLPTNIEFVQCTTDEIGTRFHASSFDAIICQHVIEHLLHSIGTMHSFHAVLKKNGRLFLETPNWVRLIMPFSHVFFWNDYTHVRPFSKAAFRRIFAEYGFKEQVIVSRASSDFITAKRFRAERPYIRRAVGFCIRHFVDPFFKDVLIGIAVK